jgi:protein involved in polysaccharide export with SLBB domain
VRSAQGGYILGFVLVAGVLTFATGCARQGSPVAALPPLDAPLPQPPGQATPYRIKPGDLLRVKFLYHPELDVKVPVRPDGGITLQVGGDIHAAGLTTDELAQVIVDRTKDRLREPEVSVLVAQTADLKVYVMGEVRVPGIVPYREGMTPLQAIADRGGFLDTARVDSVLRLSPGDNEYQGTRLDLAQALRSGAPEDVELRPGDVLYVPRTFIGDVNAFVRLYIRGLLPVEPRVGAGTSF